MFMTQQLLYMPNICTGFEQVSSKGMTKAVGRGPAPNPAFLQGAGYHLL